MRKKIEITSKKNFTFYNVYKTEKWILTIFGFYPEKESLLTRGTVRGVINFILSIVFIIDMIVPAFSNFSFETIKNSGVWITELAFIIKLSVFIYNRRIVLKIEEALQNPLLNNFPQDSLKEVFNEINFTQKFCQFYRYVIIFYIMLSIVPSFQMNERNLLYNGFPPCSLNNNHCYVILIIYQIICSYITGLVNINIELFFSCLVTISCCLFNIIKYNLQNIDYTKMQSTHQLRANIILHLETLRFVDDVNKLFNWIIFPQCLASMFSICGILFGMLKVQTSSEFISIFFFFMGAVLQIWVFCWFGNNMTFEAQAIREACYMGNWYEGGPKIRKILGIFMEKTKQQVTMRPGGFFSLTLNTFTQILKTAYSFLTVVQQAYE